MTDDKTSIPFDDMVGLLEDAKSTGRLPELAQTMRRSDLLPRLFLINGAPFSLKDYDPLRALYDGPRPKKEILMSARQLGKSANFARSETLDSITIPNFHNVYVAPLKEQAVYFSTQALAAAMASCSVAAYLQENAKGEEDSPHSPVSNSILHKRFTNGSSNKLTYAKTSPDRARGIYADRLDFDEVQDQSVDNMNVIAHSVSQSPWGLTRYAGTAKTEDNVIEYLWRQSSMDEWVMKCSCNRNGGGWNIPNLEGRVYDMIQVQGPSCVHCGKLLNVRNGQFVSGREGLRPLFTGRHIPQLIIPAIVENRDKWMEFVSKVRSLPLDIVCQELLGISCSSGSRVITADDIRRNSVLEPTNRLMYQLHKYKLIVSGIDWGIAERTSFTVHAVIGMTYSGEVHVLWANRYIGYDPERQLQAIAKTHKFYGASHIFADAGMGFEKNWWLYTKFGFPLTQIQYVRQNSFLRSNPLQGVPRYTVDKFTALSHLFHAIRYDRIKFPPYEQFEKYTCDLLSPYEHTTNVQGLETRRYMRNPNAADDFAHALCFGYTGILYATGQVLMDAVPDEALIGKSRMRGVPEEDSVDPRNLHGA